MTICKKYKIVLSIHTVRLASSALMYTNTFQFGALTVPVCVLTSLAPSSCPPVHGPGKSLGRVSMWQRAEAHLYATHTPVINTLSQARVWDQDVTLGFTSFTNAGHTLLRDTATKVGREWTDRVQLVPLRKDVRRRVIEEAGIMECWIMHYTTTQR